MVSVVLSSGHGLKVQGAIGPEPWGLNEVDEARRVVDEVATVLRRLGAEVTVYHDDVSDDQQENLSRIVDFHNAQTPRDFVNNATRLVDFIEPPRFRAARASHLQAMA